MFIPNVHLGVFRGQCTLILFHHEAFRTCKGAWVCLSFASFLFVGIFCETLFVGIMRNFRGLPGASLGCTTTACHPKDGTNPRALGICILHKRDALDQDHLTIRWCPGVRLPHPNRGTTNRGTPTGWWRGVLVYFSVFGGRSCRFEGRPCCGSC